MPTTETVQKLIEERDRLQKLIKERDRLQKLIKERDRLQAKVLDLKGANEKLKTELSDLKNDNEMLRDSLRDMCCQFSGWINGGYSTNGLSALEFAFETLDWSDPQICEEAQCDEPKCKKQRTCGIPTDSGYRNVCSEHYIMLMGNIE